MSLLPWQQPAIIAHTQILLDSFAHWLQRPLYPVSGTPEQQAEALFFAPFVVVSHGTQIDPILNYGNQMALELWEMDWATLIQTPSRQTAEPLHQAQRAEMLNRSLAQGFIDNYSGIRITTTGHRFQIKEAIVWNLRDASGLLHGQAATFSQWQFIG